MGTTFSIDRWAACELLVVGYVNDVFGTLVDCRVYCSHAKLADDKARSTCQGVDFRSILRHAENPRRQSIIFLPVYSCKCTPADHIKVFKYFSS